MTVQDTIRHMEMERLKHEAEQRALDEDNEARRVRQSNQAYIDMMDNQPSALEGAGAAFQNTPLYKDVSNWYNTLFMEPDPEFDAVAAAHTVKDEIGTAEAEKLWDAGSKEEFDFLVEDFKQQQLNERIAQTSLTGQISRFVAQELSAENLLFSAATLGVSRIGTVAKAANQGVMANTLKAGVAGGLSSYIGANIDADYTVGFSHEDSALAAFIGMGFGAGYGRFAGRVYEPKPKEATRLYDAGGALGDAARRMFNRAVGNGYKQYEKFHKSKAAEDAAFRDSIDRNESVIYKEDIDDIDFTQVGTEDFDKELMDWEDRNQIEQRRSTKSVLEDKVDKFTPLKSEYSKFSTSASSTARALGAMLYEAGTGFMVKNNSGSVQMERLQMVNSARYMPEYRNHFQAYSNRRSGEAGLGKFGNLKNFFKYRKEFNEEFVLYMNARSNGIAREASREVKALADKFDEANEAIRRHAANSGVEGFVDTKRKAGYLHQRHERSYYAKAVAEFGESAVVSLLAKAIMSKHGAGITDVAKANEMAKAFVNRFAYKPSDRRAASVMDDDAWDVMQQIFEDQGMDFDGNDVKDIFNEKVATKKDRDSGIRYSKQRMPLDMSVEHNGLRMIDLINTDVENLAASYAMSMSGQIALAEKGLSSKTVRDKLTKKILQEDPSMAQALDDLWQTFETGRTAGGVQDRRVAAAMKATVLGLLNNLGLTQLTESGTAMATYGIGNFFNTGSAAMRDMFNGRKSTASSALAKEISETLFPMGKEHIAMPLHLSQELQSNSKLATTTLMDKTDTAINMGLAMQGMTSLFNQARSMQHLVAYEGLTHKIGRYVQQGKRLDTQLARLGMSEQLYDRISDSIKKHGKLNKDGTVDMLGINKWDLDTQEQFANLVVRNQTNIVQKALAGEGSAWMSKDYGALLTQLRKFPLESIRKQLIRKQNISTVHLAQSAVYNTVVAGSVITAMNYLKGNNTEKDLTNALRFGMVYNADLGSVASIWDLGVSVTGAPESAYVNPWARYSSGIFAVPALDVANAYTQLPLGWLDGGFEDYDEKRAIKMLPIVGNHVAIMGAFQAFE